jgi:hypothetical protein
MTSAETATRRLAHTNPVSGAVGRPASQRPSALATLEQILTMPLETRARRPRTRAAVIAVAVIAVIGLAAAAIGSSVLRTRDATADQPASSALISALAPQSPTIPAAAAKDLAGLGQRDVTREAAISGSTPDVAPPLLDQARVLRSDLGRDHLAIEAMPSAGNTVCFGIVDRGSTCAPLVRFASGFSYLIQGVDGAHVIGVTRDDVTSIEIDIDGTWNPLPIVNNTFFYELSTSRSMRDVLYIRSTLADGSQHTQSVFGAAVMGAP